MDDRGEPLSHLTGAVETRTAAHPVRVAVDGPPAAGKTTLADLLAAVLRAQGRAVLRATIDDFLLPRARRYARGEFSAESCYFDAHDHDALNRVLLDPLGPDGDRRRMTVDTIVRLTSYLTDASHAEANAEARVAALGGRVVPTTAVVVQTLDSGWLIEIEVIAAA